MQRGATPPQMMALLGFGTTHVAQPSLAGRLHCRVLQELRAVDAQRGDVRLG